MANQWLSNCPSGGCDTNPGRCPAYQKSRSVAPSSSRSTEDKASQPGQTRGGNRWLSNLDAPSVSRSTSTSRSDSEDSTSTSTSGSPGSTSDSEGSTSSSDSADSEDSTSSSDSEDSEDSTSTSGSEDSTSDSTSILTSHSQDSTAASDSEDATPISDPEYSPLTGPATSPASISYSIAASNGSTEFIDERDIITGPLAPPPYNTPYTSPPPAYGDVENTTLLATGEPVGDDGPGDDDGVQYDPYIWTDEDLAALEDYFGLNRYDIFNYRMVIMSLGGYITYLAIIATVVG